MGHYSDTNRTNNKLTKEQLRRLKKMISPVMEFALKLDRVRYRNATTPKALFIKQTDLDSARKHIRRVLKEGTFTLRTEKDFAEALGVSVESLRVSLGEGRDAGTSGAVSLSRLP